MSNPLPVNGRRRTAAATTAATLARRQQKAQRLAVELAPRVALLPSDYLAALAGVLVAECAMRGLPVPDLLAE